MAAAAGAGATEAQAAYFAKIDELRERATQNFRFHGSRVVNASTTIDARRGIPINRNSIPAGPALRPLRSYIELAEESNDSNGSGENIGTGRVIYPKSIAKIKPDRTVRTAALREKLFIPLKIEGLDEWLERQFMFVISLSRRNTSILTSYSLHGDRLVNGYARGTLGTDIWSLVEAMLGDANIPLAYSFYDQFNEYKRKGLLLRNQDGVEIRRREDLLLVEDSDINSAESSNENSSAPNENINMPLFEKIIRDNKSFFSNPGSIATLLEQYKRDLTRIIESAPRLTHDIVVYRGIESEKHLTSKSFKTTDFLSTTLDPYSVLPFTKKIEDTDEDRTVDVVFYCCVYEITVHKTVPCIYMQPIGVFDTEFEVLIPPGMTISFADKVDIRMKPPTRTPEVLNILYPRFKEYVSVVAADIRKVKKVRAATKSIRKEYSHRPTNYRDTKKKRRRWTRGPPPSPVPEDNSGNSNS